MNRPSVSQKELEKTQMTSRMPAAVHGPRRGQQIRWPSARPHRRSAAGHAKGPGGSRALPDAL